MIIICTGNVGSGKTASIVREILTRPHKKYLSNIVTTDVTNNTVIDSSMIIQKEITGYKNKRDGTKEPITELKLNVDFWKNQTGSVDVIIDEAHTIMNSRRSMSKVNILLTDWLALIRRVLGQSDLGEGNLYLITQLPKRIDTIAREMATQIRWHRSHFLKSCQKCTYTWKETSDYPDQKILCPSCTHHKIVKHSMKIEVLCFANIREFEYFEAGGKIKPYKHYFIKDIEKVFKYYNTLQWDNMLSELY